jgi:hypothetical protein
MLYMVIERFKEGSALEIYRRFREKGRMMPEGLEYISSWIDFDFKTCWQLMQTKDLGLFDMDRKLARFSRFRNRPRAHFG